MMNKPLALENGEWLLPIIRGLKDPNLAFINRRTTIGRSEPQK